MLSVQLKNKILAFLLVIGYFSLVIKGIPDEPGRLCDGETSKWML